MALQETLKAISDPVTKKDSGFAAGKELSAGERLHRFCRWLLPRHHITCKTKICRGLFRSEKRKLYFLWAQYFFVWGTFANGSNSLSKGRRKTSDEGNQKAVFDSGPSCRSSLVSLPAPILPTKIPAHYQSGRGGWPDKGSRLEIFDYSNHYRSVGMGSLGAGLSAPWKQPEISNEAFIYRGISMLFVFNGLFLWCCIPRLLGGASGKPGKFDHTNHRHYSGRNYADSVRKHHAEGKAQRVFGVRTKWSMANDTCWNLSQRFGGMSFHYRYPDYWEAWWWKNPAYQSILW